IAEGLHTWNVKVFDYAGNWEWYGPDWQFKVDLTPPVAGGKDEPLNYPLSAPPKISVYKASTSGAKSATVTFKWKSSTDSGAGASGIDKADLILKDGNQTSIIGTYHGLQTAGGDFTITSTGSGSYSRTINEGIYTWNMEIFDRATNSSLYDSGLFWKFVVDGTPPTAGIKTAPQHANIDSPDYTYDSLTHISKSNIVNFYWSAASDPFPSGGAVTYNITLYKEATTTKVTGYPKIGVISPFTNPTPLQDGDYTWNVTAVDQAGHETDYDGPGSANISKWNLKVDTTPPASGTLQGIKDGLGTHMGAFQASGIDINTGTPTFIWKAAKDPKPSFGDESGIDKYKIVIEIPRGTIKFDSGYIQKSSADLNNGTFSPNLSFTLPDDKKLADDGPYYWTIYVKDVAGNETKYDQQWNFYVDTKLGFETLNYELLVSRENAKLPGSPALYEPSPNYEVLVSGAPPIVYTNEYTPVTDIVPSAPDPASNRYGTTFYWSVRNQDETGLWGKYEDYAVNIVTLYSGELVKPTDKSYCPTKPKFEWTHAKPEEVRRGYRIVVYKGTAWPAGAPALATDKYIDQTFISETGLDLPLEYQAVNALPDGKYFWSVYSIDDMTKETRFNQVWSFEIIRKPFVTMASQNIKWYAGYPNCVFVDAFGANGYETLATCEVTLYRDAAGTIPIRKFTQTKEGLLPAAIKILDSSDSLERMEASKMANQTMSYTITDSKYPSDKRYLFNISPYYNYLDKYTDGKIYARAKVYFYDINNTSETNIYTEYPDSSKSELPVLVGEVENKVKLRPYVPNSSSDTASVFFAQGVKKISNGEPVYAFLRPDITKPPDTVQYVDSETSSENLLSIYYNGMAYFESPHSASSSSLDAASSGALKAGDGSKLVWRITRFQNNLYDATMRTKLFKNADYIPQNTYDFMKVLAAFTGKQPISVSLATINSVPGGDTAGVALKWAISLDDGDTRPGDMPQSYL
ncbi:MAG TPA: hypothetical protein PKL57_13700, partial [Candidatus Wallbacteria bacterium]|nr:hypothetical protein [Candidatus Wallbacteria bacterium]